MTTSSKQNYTLPIVMMFALFAMISFVTGLQNPLGLIVKDQFALDNLGSQLPTFANFFAYAFLGIPAGLLLQKVGYKKTALIAIAVGILGVATMFCSGLIGGSSKSTFYIYLLGAFISGISMCMLNTVVNPMLNTLGGGGNRGNQLIQFGGSCNSMAATIAPVLGGYLIAGVVGTKTIANANPIFFIAMGIFALALIVLSAVNIPEPRLNAPKKDAEDKHSPLSFRHFILGAVAIGVYVGVEVGIPNIANLYMTNPLAEGGLGIDATTAGSIVGTYWFLMLIGRLVGGVLGGKIASKTMLVAVSGLGLAFVVLAMILPATATVSMPVFKSDISFGLASGVPVRIMFLILCGLCTSVMWGGIFNLAVEGLGKYTEAASGIFMVMVCGGGILPLIQGFVADLTTYMTSYVVIVLSLVYLLYYAFIGSKNVNTDISVE
ncbi:MAG: MFS transporter [Rikenellaceae bacterium]